MNYPFYFTLILLAVLSRLVPHPANVAPIAALALFVGAKGSTLSNHNRWLVYGTPFLALLISDTVIGFYTWQVMVAVYGGFTVTLGLGLWVRNRYHSSTIFLASLVGSIVFFLLTNAAVWAFTPMYAKTFAGLAESYAMALPFFRNSLLGDLAYSGVIFGAYELAIRASRLTRTRPLASSTELGT